jgi:hypothetical protein
VIYDVQELCATTEAQINFSPGSVRERYFNTQKEERHREFPFITTTLVTRHARKSSGLLKRARQTVAATSPDCQRHGKEMRKKSQQPTIGYEQPAQIILM